MQTKQYIVRGNVQGVGFRWFTQKSAERHGIHGWVKNLSDGRVEIRARGDEAALLRFESDIRTGPSGARVDGVTIASVDDRSESSGFFVQ